MGVVITEVPKAVVNRLEHPSSGLTIDFQYTAVPEIDLETLEPGETRGYVRLAPSEGIDTTATGATRGTRFIDVPVEIFLLRRTEESADSGAVDDLLALMYHIDGVLWAQGPLDILNFEQRNAWVKSSYTNVYGVEELRNVGLANVVLTVTYRVMV